MRITLFANSSILFPYNYYIDIELVVGEKKKRINFIQHFCDQPYLIAYIRLKSFDETGFRTFLSNIILLTEGFIRSQLQIARFSARG